MVQAGYSYMKARFLISDWNPLNPNTNLVLVWIPFDAKMRVNKGALLGSQL